MVVRILALDYDDIRLLGSTAQQPEQHRKE